MLQTIKQIKNLLQQSATLTGAVECKPGNKAPVCNLRDGDVFPDTYTVARGTPRLAVLDLARKRMSKIYEVWMRTNRRMPIYIVGDYSFERMYMLDEEIALLRKLHELAKSQLSSDETSLFNSIIKKYSKKI